MKYQVNLYPERVQRAAQVRRGILRGSVLGIVLGLDLLLIGFLVISGFQIRERVRELNASIAAAESQASPVAESPDQALAARIVQARLDRVDWAPFVEAVATSLPDDLILYRIDAGTGRSRGTLNGADLEGRVAGGSRELSSVIRFMQTLRENPKVSRQFPAVDLGTAGGSGLQDFAVVLRKSAPKAPSPPEEAP